MHPSSIFLGLSDRLLYAGIYIRILSVFCDHYEVKVTEELYVAGEKRKYENIIQGMEIYGVGEEMKEQSQKSVAEKNVF